MASVIQVYADGETSMTEKQSLNLLDQQQIEDFIKSLGQAELVYMNQLIVSRLQLLREIKA